MSHFWPVYGHLRLLGLLSFTLIKQADLLGCRWSRKKSGFSILSGGGERLKPHAKWAVCCFSLNTVFWFTHQFLQWRGKLLNPLYSKSTLSKVALELEWEGGFFNGLCAILTVCTKISIVRTICGLNTEFQDVGLCCRYLFPILVSKKRSVFSLKSSDAAGLLTLTNKTQQAKLYHCWKILAAVNWIYENP